MILSSSKIPAATAESAFRGCVGICVAEFEATRGQCPALCKESAPGVQEEKIFMHQDESGSISAKPGKVRQTRGDSTFKYREVG